MADSKILIVEDEEDVLELIRFNLTRDGYETESALNGRQAVTRSREFMPDLILLDLMLPELDGVEVCKILKRDNATSPIPIIMLTAKGEESDIVAGLEVGADDYITKPFSPKVLLARIKTVLRRNSKAQSESSKKISRGPLTIDTERHEVLLDGKLVNLTLTEFKVLHFLARKPGRVFTRYQIVDATKGDDYVVTDRAVDVQVVGLRKKLGQAGKLIETVRGVGYKFKDD
jgi:two-component system phosphate regulon response regulator PhoB